LLPDGSSGVYGQDESTNGGFGVSGLSTKGIGVLGTTNGGAFPGGDDVFAVAGYDGGGLVGVKGSSVLEL